MTKLFKKITIKYLKLFTNPYFAPYLKTANCDIGVPR